jgi:hypothetical protein
MAVTALETITYAAAMTPNGVSQFAKQSHYRNFMEQHWSSAVH